MAYPNRKHMSFANYMGELRVELQTLHAQMYRVQTEILHNSDSGLLDQLNLQWVLVAAIRQRRLQDMCNLCDIHRSVLGRGTDPTGVIGHPEILGIV